jgi:hypothetical protein
MAQLVIGWACGHHRVQMRDSGCGRKLICWLCCYVQKIQKKTRKLMCCLLITVLIM